LGERPGSGDGEGWTLLTRQMPFEPLPASVLLGDSFLWDSFIRILGELGNAAVVVQSEDILHASVAVVEAID